MFGGCSTCGCLKSNGPDWGSGPLDDPAPWGRGWGGRKALVGLRVHWAAAPSHRTNKEHRQDIRFMNAGWKNLIKNKGLSLRMCWHLGGVKGTRGWPGSEDMTIRAIAVEFRG